MSGGGKRYSLARLLASQPAALRKRPDFADLSALLGGSEKLRRVRLPAVAFRLLNEPRLKTRFAENFRSTYRFPKGPFLLLFLSMKWGYRAERESARLEKERRIEAIMASCPREAAGILEFLRRTEAALNPGAPEWKAGPYPKTLKRARELAGLGLKSWLPLIARHRSALGKRYRSLRLPPADALLACAVLGCFPDARTGKPPSKDEIRLRYRIACKAHHPDLGGDPGRFILAKKARDFLLESPSR